MVEEKERMHRWTDVREGSTTLFLFAWTQKRTLKIILLL